jgi:RNA polymerase sigma factor (sigma-70 family)
MAQGQSEAVRKPRQGLLDTGGVARTAIADIADGPLLARFAACRDELAEVAFAILVRRHGPMVLRVCHQILGDRHTAEDAFQATFLILARRAGSIRQPELLGNWLHGVALRTAREARMRDDRRRRRESSSGDQAADEPAGKAPRPELEVACREDFEVLHEEVSRLPERYRIPVVLCDLEGLTYQQAADRLHCPPSTIGVRLMRARERLRVRLTRRGLAPTAGLLGALVCADNAGAALSSPLVIGTVRAAMGFVSNPAAATGLVSPPVFALAGRVLRNMALKRLSAAVGLGLAVGFAATFWAVGHRDSHVLAAQERGTSRSNDEAAPATTPASPGPVKARPEDERAHPTNPPAPILADRGAPKPPLEAAARDAGADRDATHGPHDKVAEIEKAPVGKGPALVVVPASARRRRAVPDEQAKGEALFAKEWLPDDPRSHGGDGLGPVYNDTSCVACHSLGAPGGAGPVNKNVVLVTAAPTGCGPSGSLDQLLPGFRGSRSAVLHRFSTDPGYVGWRRRLADPKSDGEVKKKGGDPVTSRIFALREAASPDRQPADLAPRSAAIDGFTLSQVERNTPPLFGAGLIDDIPSDVLTAMAESQSREIRGRVGRTRTGRIGRFGWKAQIPSLHEFVRVACANELGLEVPGHSQAASPLAPGSKARGLDLTESECDALVSYVRALPAPVVVDPDGSQGTRDLRDGRRLFGEVGCATCHAPSLGDVKGIYSDLLLHNMGQSLSDPASSYGLDGPEIAKGPSPREWRTPPLWGYRDSGPYLHDGRAQGLEEAVAFHDGQAKASAHQFFSLSWRERAQVEMFLKSLMAPSAAAAPGMMLAADLESRLEREYRNSPESQVRRQREAAVARDERRFQERRRHELAQDAAKRARARLPLARSLEKMGKTTGAISFYREIARDAADTEEGRIAAERIHVLSTRVVTP